MDSRRDGVLFRALGKFAARRALSRQMLRTILSLSTGTEKTMPGIPAEYAMTSSLRMPMRGQRTVEESEIELRHSRDIGNDSPPQKPGHRPRASDNWTRMQRGAPCGYGVPKMEPLSE
jgi:hypothetical protein